MRVRLSILDGLLLFLLGDELRGERTLHLLLQIWIADAIYSAGFVQLERTARRRLR